MSSEFFYNFLKIFIIMCTPNTDFVIVNICDFNLLSVIYTFKHAQFEYLIILKPNIDLKWTLFLVSINH